MTQTRSVMNPGPWAYGRIIDVIGVERIEDKLIYLGGEVVRCPAHGCGQLASWAVWHRDPHHQAVLPIYVCERHAKVQARRVRPAAELVEPPPPRAADDAQGERRYIMTCFAKSRFIVQEVDAERFSKLPLGSYLASKTKDLSEQRDQRAAFVLDLSDVIENPHARLRDANGDALFSWLFTASNYREAMSRAERLLGDDVPIRRMFLTKAERRFLFESSRSGSTTCPHCAGTGKVRNG